MAFAAEPGERKCSVITTDQLNGFECWICSKLFLAFETVVISDLRHWYHPWNYTVGVTLSFLSTHQAPASLLRWILLLLPSFISISIVTSISSHRYWTQGFEPAWQVGFGTSVSFWHIAFWNCWVPLFEEVMSSPDLIVFSPLPTMGSWYKESTKR